MVGEGRLGYRGEGRLGYCGKRRLGYRGECQILGVETAVDLLPSCPFITCSCREAWTPKQHQATGRLGLQCCPRVDSTPGHRQYRTHGLHGAEGGQKDRGESGSGVPIGIGKEVVQPKRSIPLKGFGWKPRPATAD